MPRGPKVNENRVYERKREDLFLPDDFDVLGCRTGRIYSMIFIIIIKPDMDMSLEINQLFFITVWTHI